MKCFCRTTTNCRLNPSNNTSNDGSGDVTEDGASSCAGVVAEVESEVNFRGNASVAKEEKDEKPNVREIGDTPKPPARLSKKQKEAEHLQSQMVHMLNQEDDEIDLVFQAMSK